MGSHYKPNCDSLRVRRYTVELYPTESQKVFFKRQFELFRYVYNWALGKEIESRDSGNGFIGRRDLYKLFSEYRNSTEWLKEIPLNTAREALSNLLYAYDLFFEKKARFPKFKSRHKSRQIFQTRNEQFAFRFYDDCVRISGLPPREFVKCGHHNLPINKEAKFYQPTIYFDGYRYWLSVACEMDTNKPFTGNEDDRIDSIGIDVGLRTTIQLSTGDSFNMPDIHVLQKRSDRIRGRLDRMRYRRVQESKRTKTKFYYIPKTENEKKLEYRFYLTNERMKNIRHSFVHEATTAIANMYPKRIVVETLDYEGLIQNAPTSKISRRIKNTMFAKIHNCLEYKCRDRGIEFVRAPAEFPSSQICSKCGNRWKDTSHRKTYVCPCCGAKIDRDLNAAINLSRV